MESLLTHTFLDHDGAIVLYASSFQSQPPQPIKDAVINLHLHLLPLGKTPEALSEFSQTLIGNLKFQMVVETIVLYLLDLQVFTKSKSRFREVKLFSWKNDAYLPMLSNSHSNDSSQKINKRIAVVRIYRAMPLL